MKDRSSRWFATTSAALVILLAAVPAKTARRPRYGGTLRVEIGAAIQSLDVSVPPATAEEAAAKAEIDALIYDRSDAKAAQPAAGPFRISAWEPGKRLVLAENDDCPQGRPFVDSIEITMGRAAKDRMLDLELGKTDFIEIPQDQARRAADAGIRVSESQPDELLAILFLEGFEYRAGDELRRAVAMAADRASVVNFVLQRTGEPAGGLLPQWLSGTEFLFSTTADPAGAKKQVEEIRGQNEASRRVVMGYDSGDSVEQTVAERIVVNARDAGMAMTAAPMPVSSSGGEAAALPRGLNAQIVRWRMTSEEPGAALAGFLQEFPRMADMGICTFPKGAPGAEAIYRCEQAIVETHEIVPLAFLPEVYGLSARVRDWQAPKPGESWPLAEVWLEENP
jgi:peptide/nickel transport system substrate-binding protein